VTGKVTDIGTSAAAKGLRVASDCAGSKSTTTTDDKGDYEFLVGPGACTITPQRHARPLSRSFTVRNNVDNVNFRV
jgi:hypothetical protein